MFEINHHQDNMEEETCDETANIVTFKHNNSPIPHITSQLNNII